MEEPTADNFMEGASLTSVEQAITGENPYLFRAGELQYEEGPIPSVRVTSPIERTEEELTALTPRFSEHAAVTGQPFTASYYRLDKVYPALSLEEKTAVGKVERYLSRELTNRHLSDSPESASSLIQSLEAKLNLTPNHDPYYRLEKLASWIDTMGEWHEQMELRKTLIRARRESES